MPETRIERVSHGGWPNCFRLTNDDVELIVTSDVGPRILRCGFIGSQNLFANFEDQLGKSGENRWMMRGGHRLWVAPEIVPDTYALDNHPVKARVEGGTLTLLANVEPETGLRKEMSIELAPSGEITVMHRIENTGAKSRQFALWALTQMAIGGLAIAPFPRSADLSQLQPTHPLVMWAYTDFSDERWMFTRKYLILHAHRHKTAPQKAGLFNEKTFAAYLLGAELFTKRSIANPHLPYPDFHCSLELYTNSEFLELETLGPLVDLVPGNSVGHVEHWSLLRNVRLNSLAEEEIDRLLQPLMK